MQNNSKALAGKGQYGKLQGKKNGAKSSFFLTCPMMGK